MPAWRWTIYLDGAVNGDRSRLARAGDGSGRTAAGFYTTVADPSSTAIWTIGEVAVPDDARAVVVKRP